MVVDGNSGSVHVVDDTMYEIISSFEEFPSKEAILKQFSNLYSTETLEDIYETLVVLRDENVLYTSDRALEQAVVNKKTNPNVKALCLHVAHDCNLACKYCFASEGDYKSGKSLMSLDVAKKSIDYLLEHSTGRKKIEVDFFGGEPLLNFEVVKETVYYAKEKARQHHKQFHFTLTTNGVLLDSDTINFLNEHMDNVVISIDGRREVHDQIRPNRAGKGSYDVIVPRAKELVNKRNGKSYYIRGTFTSFNQDFSNDVMHLADLGFKEISVEPVVGSGREFHFKDSDVDGLLKEYESLAIQYIERLKSGADFNFYHFNINVLNGPCLYKRITACGAGGEYLAVSPEGTFYPCHQFVGEPDFVIGNIDDGIHNHNCVMAFTENSVLTKEACQSCWAKLFCSGGCHANAYFSNGDIHIPNEISCTLQKKRIECALMIQAWKNDLMLGGAHEF